MRCFFAILFIYLTYNVSAQETFPFNGVKDNFYPTYAFINGTIVSAPNKQITNGVLLIKNDRIIAVDSGVNIPENAIIKDLNGAYIYPSFNIFEIL